MRHRKSGDSSPGMISAQEIACWAYCPESWRLQYGLGLEADNRQERAAGTRHHERKAAVERVAGGSIAIGRFLAVVAVLAMLLAWVLSR